MTTQKKFAIVIEDSGELFLFLDINRDQYWNVYVNFNEHHQNHKPHSSYHTYGQLHHKSQGYKALPPKKLQPPNDKFSGSQNIITTCIKRGDGKAWNVRYKKEDYLAAMIIKDDIIVPEFGYQLAIDLVQSGNAPVGYAQSSIKIIQQQIFNPDMPQIVASLYEAFLT